MVYVSLRIVEFSFMAFLLLNSFSTATAKEKIRIGFFRNPPQAFCENGKCKGGIIEYWNKYVGPLMGVDIEWVGPLPPVRLLESLEKGDINCIALLAKNNERAKLYDYPEKPFFMINSGIAVLKTSKLKKVSSADDLVGLTMGFFEKGFIHPSLKYKRIKWNLSSHTDWQDQNLKRVAGGWIDACYVPDISPLVYAIKMNPKYAKKLTVLAIPNTKKGLYSVFSKMDNGKYLKKYNIAHKAVLKKIRYQTILNKYLK